MNTNAIDTSHMRAAVCIRKQCGAEQSNGKQLIMYIEAFELHYSRKKSANKLCLH